MRAALPPPEAPRSNGLDPTFDDSLSPVAREVIERGETALKTVRCSLDQWVAVGAGLKTLQQAAMYRAGTNQPLGARYVRAYQILSHPWPELVGIDPATRRNAIWLFDNEDLVKAWLTTLTQRRRDRWTHPATIRRHYEGRYPAPPYTAPKHKRRPQQRHTRPQERNPLGERSRADLEVLVAEYDSLLADRDREILDRDTVIDEQARQIAQLRNDLAWALAANKQLEGLVTPPVEALPTTVKRPDGETVEILHAIMRRSQEITPPIKYGQPDFSAWAKVMKERTETLSAPELRWLLADNRAHLDAYERMFSGAGIGLADRINARIVELLDEQSQPHYS
jgi:hypothetical protein